MTHFPVQRLLPLIALAAGGAILAGGLEWQPEVPAVHVAPSRVEPPAERSADDGGRIAALVDELRRRPLFTPGRRAYEPADVGPGQPSVPAAETDAFPPVPEIRGTAVSGERSVAIVIDPDDDRIRRVVAGDEVGGWTVLEIRSGKVRLRSDKADAVVYPSIPGGGPRSEVTPRAGGTQAADSAASRRSGTDGF
ncbi:hypothetical protein JL101_033835 (plasmid) [Skermanella rosea]|uniref:hypothetical protein n=1 Tax=Skermanella rosea TaxID=1817965 RepID=UPI0019347BC7|nr:hypothetical protein [Skermanella rosea]UEM07852.1 hypothetical protein JL101_033835 [Skermanella rosea]